MAENDVDHFIETIRHDETLTRLQNGQYTGPVTSQMCKDLAARIDATGLNVDLSKLPVACSGKHAKAVSEAIKMRRRNTIQRDAMHAQVRTRRPRYRADGVPGVLSKECRGRTPGKISHQIHAIDAGQRRAHRAPRPRVSASDEEPP